MVALNWCQEEVFEFLYLVVPFMETGPSRVFVYIMACVFIASLWDVMRK